MREPERKIEQLVLGELDAVTARKLRESAEVRGREQALRESNEEILRAYPPEQIAKQILRRAARRPVRRAVWVVSVATMSLAAVLLVWSDDLPTERLKGAAPSLSIWRKTAGEPERLQEGARVSAGDVIQIAYSAKGARYGAVVSLDGRGQVTWHLPAQGAQAAALERQPAPLASAYELDAAPGFERFIFVTAQTPFELAVVKDALAQLVNARGGPLHLPIGMTQQSVTVVK